MNVLVDTNVLTRLAEPGHAMYRPALDATNRLRMGGHAPCMVPQNLYEFWVVGTRPLAANGLGKSAAEIAADVSRFRVLFRLLPDGPDVLPAWEALVTRLAVVGKVAHDARLVAAMQVHAVTHILTFNVADFARFPVVAIDPTAVAAPPTP